MSVKTFLLHKKYGIINAETRRIKADAVKRTGKPVSFECTHDTKKWRYTIYPLCSSDGEIKQLLVISGDIEKENHTVRKINFKDISALNTLYDAVPASVIVVDVHMHLVSWNRFSRDTINGLSDKEMSGVNPFLRVHPDDRTDLVNRVFINVLMFDVEGTAKFRMYHKDSPHYKWATARTRRAVIDGQLYVVAVVTDTTELKKEEEIQETLQHQLQQSQKMELIGQLAGGIAHDFNNVMTGILCNAEMILDEIDPSNPFFEKINDIYRLASRSAKLTRQLLAFAKKDVVKPAIIDLHQAVADLIPVQRRLIGENIQIVLLPCTDHYFVNIDPVQLDQILTNLFVNSRDAIDGCGLIRISCDHVRLGEHDCQGQYAGFTTGDYIHLFISDTGCGIDRKNLPHIFEPFFTTKDIGKGTGLGLSTVYGIVKQNKGFITCRSEVGRGTSFDIYLPQLKDVVPEKELLFRSVIHTQSVSS
ncbi:MAG: PAS domain S-box protein [Chlorobiaceae bacterium]|nr:PAS domain S-box protein [Chlorobiaceae bacterium]